jgi:RNA polymerase sigma-70 factor (ECF subfamily)
MDDVDARVRSAVTRHLGLVWRVLRRAGLSAADADEASQDVFWVLARRHSDVPERSERAFLVSTALRVASDRRRSKWNRSVLVPLDEAMVASASAPDALADARRGLERLDRALRRLDEPERAVLVLMDIEQFSKSEAAKALGIPEGTAASRLKRARAALMVALEAVFDTALNAESEDE